MKNLLLSCLILLLAYAVTYGQTNSYPTSGNVKIFAANETWAEGVVVTQPSGWGGLRLSRNGPSSGNYHGNWALGYTIGNDLSISTNHNGTQYDGIFHISHANRYVGIGTSAPRGKFDVDGPGDIFLADDVNAGSLQSVFLPGHIYIAPHGGQNISFLQARRYNDTGSTELRIRTYNNGSLTDAMHIEADGDIGIGTTSPDAKLAVKGTIHSREVRVDLSGAVGPDYVFEKDYNLQPLSELEAYINENKHLPEVPSANEMEANGINLKEMNLLLLKKVEELTLHLIEANKKIENLDQEVRSRKKRKTR